MKFSITPNNIGISIACIMLGSLITGFVVGRLPPPSPQRYRDRRTGGFFGRSRRVTALYGLSPGGRSHHGRTGWWCRIVGDHRRYAPRIGSQNGGRCRQDEQLTRGRPPTRWGCGTQRPRSIQCWRGRHRSTGRPDDFRVRSPYEMRYTAARATYSVRTSVSEIPFPGGLRLSPVAFV